MWTNAHSQPFSAYYRQELTFAVGNANSGIATQSCRLKISLCLCCLVFQQCSATARHKPVFYRRKKEERNCSFQLLPHTPWPDCRGTEMKDLVMPNFTRYKGGTHITVNIKIIWALSVSKSQWKDSELNTGRNKGNACPSSYNTMVFPPKNTAWHPFYSYYTSYTSRWSQLLWEAQFLGTAALKSEQSLHQSPLLLLLTTDFTGTFHLFPRQSRSRSSQTDQFKWDTKATNNRQGSGYTASIYEYSLAAVYCYSFTMKIISLELIQG